MESKNMFNLEYLANKNSQPKCYVLLLLSEIIEDYCLNKAMDEARKTPLLNLEEALEYLSEEE